MRASQPSLGMKLFLAEEMRDGDRMIEAIQAGGPRTLVVRCDRVDGTRADPEMLAAFFLHLNSYLMGLSHRPILKLFSYDCADDDNEAPFTNAFRALLQGEYSSLSNEGGWRDAMAAICGGQALSAEAIERFLAFYRSSGLELADKFKQAEVYLGSGRRPPGSEFGRQFRLEVDRNSRVLSSLSRRMALQVDPAFIGKHSTISLGSGIDYLEVAIGGAEPADAIREVVGALQSDLLVFERLKD